MGNPKADTDLNADCTCFDEEDPTMSTQGGEEKRRGAELDDLFPVGDDRQLFVDNHLIRTLHHLHFRMHPPIPREKILEFNHPWEGEVSWCPIIFRDGDRIRMWYRCETVRDPKHFFTGYAAVPEVKSAPPMRAARAPALAPFS